MAVTIDEDFARFGAKSYAINKINSVEVRERAPHQRGGAIIAGVIGGLLVISGLGQGAGPDGFNTTTIGIGAVFLAITYWQWQRSKIREYQLFLMTSSSETQAYVSTDVNEIADLRSQIETAMLHHSRGAIRRMERA